MILLNNKPLVLLCFIATPLLSACATVTRGTRQTFYVLSEPSGASVSMSDNTTCITPCAIKRKRKHEFQAYISLENHKPITVSVESSVNRSGAVSAAFGGVIGAGVDAMNGAMFGLSPNPLKVNLAPITSSDNSRLVETEKPKKKKD